MITFKQLEAFFWIAHLGGFGVAAEKLNTTQSAVSKRIQELEDQFGVELFDRSKRSARLTDKGAEVFFHARALLEQRDTLLETISDSQVLIRHFSIGVTELTALTWLPHLVEMIRSQFPRVSIEPEVELSSVLFDRLMDDTIDLIIVPDAFNDSRCIRVPLRSVENAWMCIPQLHPPQKVLSLSELSGFTMLMQGPRSGTGLVYSRWLADNDVHPHKTIHCESLVAQIGFTLSGLGISYLPLTSLRPLIESGRLSVMQVAPCLPEVRYAVYYRADRSSKFRSTVAQHAVSCCDFSNLFFRA